MQESKFSWTNAMLKHLSSTTYSQIYPILTYQEISSIKRIPCKELIIAAQRRGRGGNLTKKPLTKKQTQELGSVTVHTGKGGIEGRNASSSSDLTRSDTGVGQQRWCRTSPLWTYSSARWHSSLPREQETPDATHRITRNCQEQSVSHPVIAFFACRVVSRWLERTDYEAIPEQEKHSKTYQQTSESDTAQRRTLPCWLGLNEGQHMTVQPGRHCEQCWCLGLAWRLLMWHKFYVLEYK